MLRTSIVFTALLAAAAGGDDPYCPVYPGSERLVLQTRLAMERTVSRMTRVEPKATWSGPRGVPAVPADNIVDRHIFGRMAADGVPPAPPAGDVEILRRLSLDLTGRIPSPDRVESFQASTDPAKRTKLVDELMASEAFVDYWTAYFANRFEVTSEYYYFIGIPDRNLFYNYLRDFVARDRSYAEVATELIASSGDSFETAPLNFLVRGVQQGDPVQDTWDVLTDRITTQFLGVKTECVSCHDGANHLEEINVYLSERRRDEFWGLAAFLSRLSLVELPADAFNEQSYFRIGDRPQGVYSGVVDPNNPGPRPFRTGAAQTPVYMFSGEKPGNGQWRSELARLVVGDRQFARATVNYLWAHFFRAGIVDPPNGWDLARIDPANPPPAPWPVQPTHPELLEDLADAFIRSGYRIRPIIRLLANSRAYQLSSTYTGQWLPEYALYFARHTPRQLSPEELYDAIAKATMTETPMYVEGFDRPLYYAMQLPDPSEPRTNWEVWDFLNRFGRGDWWQTPSTKGGSVLRVLYMMNDRAVNNRAFGNRGSLTHVTRIIQAGLADREAVDRIFLATLGRWATEEEYQVLAADKTGDYANWLADVQWAALNKLDFIFNY